MIANLIQLALSFTKIGILTVGGGMAMLPLILNEMLAHGWMTEVEFIDILGISEATPGPLAVNCATFVGWRVAGLPGALTATLSLVAPSLVCVLIFGMVWRRFRHHPAMARIMAVLRPLIAGLVLAVALRLCLAVIGSSLDAGAPGRAWRPVLVAALVCVAVASERVSPVAAMLGGAALGAGLYTWT